MPFLPHSDKDKTNGGNMIKNVTPYISLFFSRLAVVLILLMLVDSVQGQQPITYDEAIIFADRKFKESSWIDAKAYYQMALRFKPDDSYATEKITEIVTKMQAKMESEELYYDHIDHADELFAAGKLNQAILQYEKALTIIPTDEYAQNQINKIVSFQAGEKEKLENYERLISGGKALLAEKKYDEAMTNFDQAQQLFPGNSEPGEQRALAASLKTEWLEKNQQCNDKMEEASRYVMINDFVTAVEKYREALSIIPDQAEALAKVKELKPLADKQKKYNTLVQKADEFYVNKDFIAAKKAYQEAATFWPEKTYAGDMIQKIDEQLTLQLKDLDKNYTAFVRKGDSLYSVAAYKEAKAEYSLALNLKPAESYPRTQLAAIDAYFADQQKAFESRYNEIVQSADSAFFAENYALAKEKYEFALTVKELDVYPAQQLELVARKMEEQAELERRNKVYLALIAEADQAFEAAQYDMARLKFKEAAALKPAENYPVGKMAEIDQLMANAEKQREIDTRYNQQIAAANGFFDQGQLSQSKEAWQQALEIKPSATLPLNKIAEIDSLLAEQALQAEIDRQYRALLDSGNFYLATKSYERSLVFFEQAATVKPTDQEATRKMAEVKTTLDEIAKEAARKLAFGESVARADMLFEEEKYELARSEYQKAAALAKNDNYPTARILEIDQLLVQLAEEREQRYQTAVSEGNSLFDAGDFQKALDEFKLAASIKPDDVFVQAKMTECEAKITEMMQELMGRYTIAIEEADKLYEAKIYDKAIAAYKNARQIKPDEAYPGEMISKITKYIEDNAITDVLNSSLTVNTKSAGKITFEPVPVNVRKSNYILVKARSLNSQPVSVIFSYGSASGKNGGFVVTMPEGDQMSDFIIRVGNQYKWFSEDNNWLEIYPENGDIELTLVRISTSN